MPLWCFTPLRLWKNIQYKINGKKHNRRYYKNINGDGEQSDNQIVEERDRVPAGKRETIFVAFVALRGLHEIVFFFRFVSYRGNSY